MLFHNVDHVPVNSPQNGDETTKVVHKESELQHSKLLFFWKSIQRIRGGRAAGLPPAHTRGLRLGGVTCGTLDRRSRAPDT
eukprot:COSAG06_NODE_44776_length_360_cov_1.367816_1_plen_80_part_10